MTEHLLLITIGPVQDFIAQARRTRDLWYGSHLVSELSRAAARSLATQGAKLIFPALESGDPELEACSGTLRANSKPPISIANKILATINSALDPESVARKAREELYKFWREDIAKPVKQNCLPLLADSIDQVWDEQIESFLEFAATWAPMSSDYAELRTKVETTIAGRKILRDFEQFKFQRGVVKSSLDGARETVLRRERPNSSSNLAAKYRIEKREQLDAIGLIKRAGGNREQFVSIVNVALAPWINFVAEREKSKQPDRLRQLMDECKNLGLSRMRSDLPCARTFPYDAEIFLPARWKSVFEQENQSKSAQSWGLQHVEPILKDFKEPSPYVACMVADGDKVGAALSSLKTAQEHYDFSRVLSEFAGNARTIVEQECTGALIYAGGDDVLAFLPVSEALACADKLVQSFSNQMRSSVLRLEDPPTLSVGIGIGHTIESMGELLNLGRQAESLAKNGSKYSNPESRRNGLGVILEKRSGSRRSWRSRWDYENPVSRLMNDAELLFENKLSIRKLYEVERILKRVPHPNQINSNENESWVNLLMLELQFCLSDCDSNLSSLGISFTQDNDYSNFHEELSSWVDRMIIAREIAASKPQLRRNQKESLRV